MNYPMNEVERIAKVRLLRRRRVGYSTPWGEAASKNDCEFVGVSGEAAFAIEFGMRIDETDRPCGDGGIDFITPAGTVDVKTRRHTGNLRIRTDRKLADYIFLAQYDEETKSSVLVGWIAKRDIEHCRVVESNTPPEFHKNYLVPRWKLKSVGEFKRLISERRQENRVCA